MKKTRYLLLLIPLLLLACANPGSGPDGGPYDETPPRITGMMPRLGETGVKKARKVTLTFNENVKLDNASEKIIVSPPQLELPEIKVNARRVSIELLDSLKPDMTYTIDFSDAIQDATEGNPMGNFTYYFSTGERLDTMEVAGHVLEAENLEPVKGMLVGLYPDSVGTDSLFRHAPLVRVARTDSRGRFSIKGVAPGRYRIYALQDMDGDFKWSRGEKLAFTDRVIEPGSYPDIRYDTAWVDTVRYDSIAVVPYTHYTPDDVLLLAFQERPVVRDLLKMVREVPNHFTAYFTAPSKHVPEIRVDGRDEPADSLFLVDRNATNDTLTYWITDSLLCADDSLAVFYTYEATNDSTYRNFLRTDTIDLMPRLSNARIAKQKADEEKKWQKALEKRHKKGDFTQEKPPVENLKVTVRPSGSLTPMQNLQFVLEEPVTKLDTAAFHLFLLEDSLRSPAAFRLVREGLLSFKLMAEWRPGQKYELVVDSVAVTGFTGKVSIPMKRGFGIYPAEEMGSLFVSLSGADTSAVVQLLSSDTKVEAQTRVRDGRADFFYLRPGNYYLRLFNDRNGNGRWDTGDFLSLRQPEEVCYFNERIEVRVNWDTEQYWDVKALPLLTQKPAALVKAKADGKRQTAHAKNVERMRNK